ncbi:class I adenylate-forming enzyme family protein [Alterinioella nitratireducens]|uniref:class I adenylate-forming enzyme family protein n=1 Tax=Alterinioella nitratireducens TaxID=2735915 RepID=UPI0015576948|nr:AMP-binding protein [Alterinioella nitratireducens]NPD18502.1 AMP-binding protein [Alterinioella nitratireducens]
MTIAQWLQATAEAHPARPALYLGHDLIEDYAGFHAAAARVAAALVGMGVTPGDRVALFLKNTPDYLIALFGAWFAGAAVVPVNAKLHPAEVAWILSNAGARLCFASPDLAHGLPALTDAQILTEVPQAAPLAAPVPRAPDDLAWLFYTSGTTGRPKGVIITHHMLTAMSDSYLTDVDQVRAQDAALYAAPLSHGAGLYSMLHVRAGARHIFPPSAGFDPAEILSLARHHGNIHMFAAPTMVKRLTDHARAADDPGTGLRSVIYAGGPMYLADIIAATDHFGDIFIQIYGQGECPMAITALSRHDVADRSHPRWRQRLASVGRAQTGVQVRVDAPPGETGEILVRGTPVMPGYWRNAQATATTLQDGWLHTGDMGYLDADGYLTLQDRSKDMIISGGSNIYPREVEEVLLQHARVTEAAVIGLPHPDWGEEVVAFIVGDATAQELDDLCLSQIARFKRPKRYRHVAGLPKNNYGKVLKTELRTWRETDP